MKYIIYQLKDSDELAKFMFRSWDSVKDSFDFNNYENVWEDALNNASDDYVDNCDRVYIKFNGCQPSEYKGHSLSMSDIVKMNDKYYYCDRYGWVEISI